MESLASLGTPPSQVQAGLHVYAAQTVSGDNLLGSRAEVSHG